jgi:hypothetical protein
VFEQGGPSEKAPVVDLSSSSDEGEIIPDTSHDFEFTQRLYGELNRALLGLMTRPRLLLLMCSLWLQLPPPPTPMKTKGKCKMIIVMILPPSQDIGKSSGGGDEDGSP